MPSSAVERLLWSRGEELVWVDDVSPFKCTGCAHVLFHHYTAECGHKLCQDCVDTQHNTNRDFRCPLPACAKPSECILWKEDAEFVEKLIHLRTHCPNRMYGCPTVIQLKDLKEHLSGCNDRKPLGIPEVLKEIVKMNANLRAEVSEIKDSVSQMKTEVKESIREIKTEVELLRTEVRGNQKKREYAATLRKTLLVRSDKTKRLKTENSDKTKRLKTLESDKTKNTDNGGTPEVEIIEPFQMTCFTLVDRYGHFRPCLTWTIGQLKEKLNRKSFKMCSETFRWTGYPFQARAKLELKEDDSLHMSLRLTEVEQAEVPKVLPRVFYFLKDNRKLANPQHRCRKVGYPFDTPFSTSLPFQRRMDHKRLFNSMSVDDQVVIEVYVEPEVAAGVVHSRDGRLEWTIEDFRKKLAMEGKRQTGSQLSPYFYTGSRGYRVQVGVLLNGRCAKRTGSGPSAHVTFLGGEFDDELLPAFRHRTCVTLVNRKQPVRSVTATVDKELAESKEYFVDLACDGSDVAKCVDNDSVLFRVTIVAID